MDLIQVDYYSFILQNDERSKRFYVSSQCIIYWKYKFAAGRADSGQNYVLAKC